MSGDEIRGHRRAGEWCSPVWLAAVWFGALLVAGIHPVMSQTADPEVGEVRDVREVSDEVGTAAQEDGSVDSSLAEDARSGLEEEQWRQQAGIGDGDGFRIGVGDLLEIEVFGLPELSRDARVGGNGRVSLPLLGAIDVLDLTLEDAQEKIESLLAERQLVLEPEVTMSVKELVSKGVSIQGAVSRPGVYQLQKPKTLLELLVEAGGLSGDSTGQNVFVLRDAADGGKSRMEIDAERLIDQGDLTLNVFLQAGDIVLVPRPKSLRVFVSGAVRNPGPISFKSNEVMTILQAISAAGGPTERANLAKVQVIRRLEEGGEDRFVVDVKAIRRGRSEDFVLDESDTVVVREWFF